MRARSCCDGFCGAEDCATCHPERFRKGHYLEDDEGEDDCDPPRLPEPEDEDDA